MSNISFGVGVGTNGTGIISNAGLSAEGDQGIELPTDEIWMDEATTVNKSNDGAVLLSVSNMRYDAAPLREWRQRIIAGTDIFATSTRIASSPRRGFHSLTERNYEDDRIEPAETIPSINRSSAPNGV